MDLKKFYGDGFETYKGAIDEKLKRKSAGTSGLKENVAHMPERLLGPTQFWQEFAKQALALETRKKESRENEELSVFVYQDCNGFRHFVVAHPEVYYWYYRQKPAEEKCSYEVRK